jgi:hypothetical protein
VRGHLQQRDDGLARLALRQLELETKTRPTNAVSIGVRKAPSPDGRAGFIRGSFDHDATPSPELRTVRAPRAVPLLRQSKRKAYLVTQ